MAMTEGVGQESGLIYGRDPRANRAVSGLLLAGCVAVLVLSAVLVPSDRGWGTHHELYFAPCLFHLFTRLPCPFCGMTTAFTHMARGEVIAAFDCHVLGPGLYALTWVLAALGLRGLVNGQWPVPRCAMEATFHRWVIVVLLVGWIVSLLRS